MAGLKELRTRIGSIKSTQKITSAMKMVAAARLRRAQDVLAKSQQYSNDMLTVVGRLYKEMRQEEKENDFFMDLNSYTCALFTFFDNSQPSCNLRRRKNHRR